jgi:hypothetical protein
LIGDESREYTMKQSLYARAYRAAEGNWRAAEVLFAHLNEGTGYAIYSYGMLVGLALELYLKAIIHIEETGQNTKGKRERRTKSLAELYQRLSQESRVAIGDNFNAIASIYEPLVLPEFIPEEVRTLAKDKIVTHDFDGTLRMMSEAFADFRYAFERPHCLVCLPTAPAIRDAVRKRILDLAPELSKH